MTVIGKGVMVILPIIAAALFGGLPHPAGSVRHSAPLADRQVLTHPPAKRYAGVAFGGNVAQEASAFVAAAKFRPGIVEFYRPFGKPFPAAIALSLWGDGAMPLIQIDPRQTSVASIANGSQDGYLRAYASAVRAFGHPVALSFGHEMNGDWYPWGWHHVAPRTFKRAWRHIYQVFRQEQAGNVTWVWTVNKVAGHNSAPSRHWWPGARYVNWIGINGYYFVHGETTFSRVFGPTLAYLRTFTGRPVIITETAASATNRKRAKDIRNLFAGALRNEITAVIWFDQNSAHGRWRLGSNSTALRRFTAAALRFVSG